MAENKPREIDQKVLEKAGVHVYDGIIRYGQIKQEMAPMDLECCHEKHVGPRRIRFGTMCWLNEDTQQAICLDCGVREKWSSKERIKKILGIKEIAQDVSTLKKERKILEDTLILLKKNVNIYRMAEQITELQKQKEKAITTLHDYLEKLPTGKEEREMLKKMEIFIKECEERQEEMAEEVSNYLHYMIVEEKKLKRKRQQQGMNDEYTEDESTGPLAMAPPA